MSPPSTSRRVALLTGASTLAAAAGCVGLVRDDATNPDAFEGGPAAVSAPDTVDHDRPFDVRVAGIADRDVVDVTVDLVDDDDRSWTATATVEVDGDQFDVNDARIVDGDPPADFGVPTIPALLQLAEPARGPRLYQPLLEQPVTVSVHDGDETLGGTEVVRQHPDPDHGTELDHEEYVGVRFAPPDGGPAPGVVVLHGSGGHPATGPAATIARRGFSTLALQYFNGPGLPPEFTEIPVEYAEGAVEWFAAHDSTAGSGIGVIGYSRGGELAGLLGSRQERVDAVVSINGSGVLFDGFPESEPASVPAWMADGDPLPSIPVQGGYAASVQQADSDDVEAATPRLDRVDGPVILVSGADDRLWPARKLHGIAAEAAEKRGASVTHLVYEDAGHSIVLPYRPVVGLEQAHRTEMGGTPPGNAVASHDHWTHVLDAFETLE